MPSTCPDLRAFVRPRDLLVVPYEPRLQRPGPRGAAVERLLARGVAVADLERVGDAELAVRFLRGSRSDAAACERVRDWAELVGFRRLWLPHAVVTLDPAAREIGDVRTRCPGCGAAFSDGGPDFWAMVRRHRLFPDRCTVCGSALPQWVLRDPRRRTLRPAAGAVDTTSVRGCQRPTGHRDA